MPKALLQPAWEMSEKELGWLEGLQFSLSAELPVWHSAHGGPWYLRRADAMTEPPVLTHHASFDEIAAVDLDRMAIQLWSEVEDSPSPAPFTISGYERVPLSQQLVEIMADSEAHWAGMRKDLQGILARWNAAQVAEDEPPDIDPLIESAWGLIANAWNGNWADSDSPWVEAAERWRDEYHKRLAGLPLSCATPELA